MSIYNLLNANSILNRLKEVYKFRYDSELAELLDKDPSTISTWRRRDSLDYKIIFSKCHDINANFILYGEMPFRRNDLKLHDIDPVDMLSSDDVSGIVQTIRQLDLSPDEKIELLSFYVKMLNDKRNVT